MANKLQKRTTYTFQPEVRGDPGRAYRAAQPKRTVWEQQEVCEYVRDPNAKGHYEAVYDPLSYATKAVWVPDDPYKSTAEALVWKCQNQMVSVTYPATPEISAIPATPSSPAQMVAEYDLGWNGGARSNAVINGDGYVSFNVPSSAVGVIAGLNINNTAPDGYMGRVIDYAFYAAKGMCSVMENGVSIPGTARPYSDLSDFRIQRLDSVVTYFIDDVEVYTSTVENGGEAWLEASLYSGGDFVNNPTINEVVPNVNGNAEFSLPKVRVTASGPNGYRAAEYALPHIEVSSQCSSSTFGAATVGLRAMQLVASDYPYNHAKVEILSPRVESSSGVPVPAFALATLYLPSMSGVSSGMTGAVGGADLLVSPVMVKGGEGTYGEATVTVPQPTVVSYDYGSGYAVLPMLARASLKIQAKSFDGVEWAETIQADFPISASLLGIEEVGVTVAVGVNFITQTEETYRFADLILVDAHLSVPGQDTQTWVTNLETSGSSTYSNFVFNSFAKLGEVYLAANDDGIYALEGTTDDGVPISALVDLGKPDFGTSQLKTVESCFLGVQSPGAMAVTIDAGGAAYTYQTERIGNDIAQQRVKLGRGIKSNYVGLQISNVAGADFELDAIELNINALKRRI